MAAISAIVSGWIDWLDRQEAGTQGLVLVALTVVIGLIGAALNPLLKWGFRAALDRWSRSTELEKERRKKLTPQPLMPLLNAKAAEDQAFADIRASSARQND